jgi:hypothetical protein
MPRISPVPRSDGRETELGGTEGAVDKKAAGVIHIG